MIMSVVVWDNGYVDDELTMLLGNDEKGDKWWWSLWARVMKVTMKLKMTMCMRMKVTLRGT